jgi:hypothetical protein
VNTKWVLQALLAAVLAVGIAPAAVAGRLTLKPSTMRTMPSVGHGRLAG